MATNEATTRWKSRHPPRQPRGDYGTLLVPCPARILAWRRHRRPDGIREPARTRCSRHVPHPGEGLVESLGQALTGLVVISYMVGAERVIEKIKDAETRRNSPARRPQRPDRPQPRPPRHRIKTGFDPNAVLLYRLTLEDSFGINTAAWWPAAGPRLLPLRGSTPGSPHPVDVRNRLPASRSACTSRHKGLLYSRSSTSTRSFRSSAPDDGDRSLRRMSSTCRRAAAEDLNCVLLPTRFSRIELTASATPWKKEIADLERLGATPAPPAKEVRRRRRDLRHPRLHTAADLVTPPARRLFPPIRDCRRPLPQVPSRVGVSFGPSWHRRRARPRSTRRRSTTASVYVGECDRDLGGDHGQGRASPDLQAVPSPAASRSLT